MKVKRGKSKNILIEGAVGSLELRVSDFPNDSDHSEKSRWVVISHPHPEFGGTMDNKVVTTLERTFQDLGYSTIAYNFRGVGLSDGVYDGGQGEQLDLQAVVNWLRQTQCFETLVLAGFSFGAFVTLSAQPALMADRLLVVAPPVGLYDFTAIETIQVPWEMVIGLEDEVVDVQEMVNWAMTTDARPSLYCRAQASHFFHGQLIWLKKIINSIY